MREDFVGAVGLDKIGRFRLDPRDTRSDADDYELVGDDSGVFGCMSLLAVTTSVRMTCHCRHRLFVFAGKMVVEGMEVIATLRRCVVTLQIQTERRRFAYDMARTSS